MLTHAMTLRSASFALLLVAYAGAPARAQGRGAAPVNPGPAAADSTPKVETAGEKEEKISQTTHAMRLDGRDIKYTATTGTLPIRLDNGLVAARMFFVAYTKDGEDAKTRPVSFLYNGAGHMIYIRPSEHKKLKADIREVHPGHAE